MLIFHGGDGKISDDLDFFLRIAIGHFFGFKFHVLPPRSEFSCPGLAPTVAGVRGPSVALAARILILSHLRFARPSGSR